MLPANSVVRSLRASSFGDRPQKNRLRRLESPGPSGHPLQEGGRAQGPSAEGPGSPDGTLCVPTGSAAPHGGTSPPMYPPALRGSLEGKACFSPASLQPMHLQSRRGAAALPPQAAPPEAPNTATERRARLRLRWVSGNRNPTPTAHPPQCYGRGRLVGFRGDRLCLVPLSCASEGGGPWVPSAASDACVPERGLRRGG